MESGTFDNLKKQIKDTLKNKGKSKDLENKSIEELLEEVNIYYQELEFQNDELQRISQDLEISKKHFANLFENAPVGYVIYDSNYVIQSANKIFFEMTGIDYPLKQNQSIIPFVHSDSQDTFYFHIQSLLKKRTPQNCFIKLVGQQKNYLVKMESNIWENKDRDIIRSAIVDLTAENELNEKLNAANAELLESNIRFKYLFDSITDPVYIHNLNGNFIMVNEDAVATMGYSKEEFLKMHVLDIDVNTNSEAVIMAAEKLLKQGNLVFEGIHKTKDGVQIPVEIHSRVVEFDGEKAIISLARDIRERKKNEQELRAAKEKAEAANLAKSEFLATMSHELRTPLNGIIGFNSLLLESKLNSSQREYVNFIHQSSEQLLKIISDILDFSSIESGNIEFKIFGVDISRLINRIFHLVSMEAEKKNLKLIKKIQPDVPAIIQADESRLEQILLNLVYNAVKFTEKGEITIEIEIKSDKIYFQVSDTGIGIPEDKQHLIFKKFSQIDSSATRKYQGSGLGLAITKSLIEKMGGTISFKSIEGQGTTFHFSLPVLSEKLEEKSVAPVNLELKMSIRKNANVLIVEDDPVNQILLKKLLQNEGLTVDIAHNGNEALEKNLENFDMIFMDIHMPKMDGIETTKIIRSKNSQIKIIGFSADAFTESIEKSMAAEMNDYLTKPINREKLRGILQKHL